MSGGRGSIPQPPAWEAGVLPIELPPHLRIISNYVKIFICHIVPDLVEGWLKKPEEIF